LEGDACVRELSRRGRGALPLLSWCEAAQRAKIVEFFAGHPGVEDDPAKALRVSRYLGDREEYRHVRLSVWGGEAPRAEAAVSLSNEEAERLARFLEDTARVPEQPAREEL
jgi:hypothetical protein